MRSTKKNSYRLGAAAVAGAAIFAAILLFVQPAACAEESLPAEPYAAAELLHCESLIAAADIVSEPLLTAGDIACERGGYFPYCEPVLRGEFFRALGFRLGVERAFSSVMSFPDYDEGDEFINGMINSGYVIGKTNGKLAACDVLSLQDLDFLFERIDWSKTKLFKSALAEPEIHTVYLPVSVELPVYEHGMFMLGADGLYRCVCSCNMPAPGQNAQPLRLDDAELEALAPSAPTADAGSVSAYIWTESALLEDTDSGVSYSIAVNARFFGQDGSGFETEPMGLIDFYRRYGSSVLSEEGTLYELSYELDLSASAVKAVRVF